MTPTDTWTDCEPGPGGYAIQQREDTRGRVWYRWIERHSGGIIDEGQPGSRGIAGEEMDQLAEQAGLSPVTDIARLRTAIARSDYSLAEYARRVLMRDMRTVQRWLSGESPIPRVVAERIAAA